MKLKKLTLSERIESGWEGWVYADKLYSVDQTLADDEILTQLAEQARQTENMAACVRKTWDGGSRIIGYYFTPQGYASTPNGPRLSLICIEGGRR